MKGERKVICGNGHAQGLGVCAVCYNELQFANERLETRISYLEGFKSGLESRLREAEEALRAVQSQCAGHADEFSGNVWRIADSYFSKGAPKR